MCHLSSLINTSKLLPLYQQIKLNQLSFLQHASRPAFRNDVDCFSRGKYFAEKCKLFWHNLFIFQKLYQCYALYLQPDISSHRKCLPLCLSAKQCRNCLVKEHLLYQTLAAFLWANLSVASTSPVCLFLQISIWNIGFSVFNSFWYSQTNPGLQKDRDHGTTGLAESFGLKGKIFCQMFFSWPIGSQSNKFLVVILFIYIFIFTNNSTLDHDFVINIR